MRKNKLILTILTVAMLSAMVTGCANKKLSESEKIEILNEIKLYDIEGDKTFTKLEKLIDENIDNYSEKEKDIMVNKYISELYGNASSLNQTLSIVGYELEDVVEKYKINVNDKKDYKKIPDNHATVRGFLQELNSKGFALEKVDENSAYIIVLNAVELNNKYGHQVSKSFSKYLEFNAYESTAKAFSNTEERTVDLEEVAKRINMIEKGLIIDKEQNYEYVSNWLSAIDYYYSILIGSNHDYFVSTEYLKDDILNKYKELAETYKDTQLGNILNQMVSLYTENGKKCDDNVLKQVIDIVEKTIYTEEINNVFKQQEEESQFLEGSVESLLEGVTETEEATTTPETTATSTP